MDAIWQNLPNEILFNHILPKCDIDTRVAFRIIPHKLQIEAYSKINKCLTKPMLKIYFRYNVHCYIEKKIKEKKMILSYTLYKSSQNSEAWVYIVKDVGCVEMYMLSDKTNKYVKL